MGPESEIFTLTATLPVDNSLDHSSLLAEVLATTNPGTAAGQLRKPHPLIARCLPARPPAPAKIEILLQNLDQPYFAYDNRVT